MGSIAYFDFKHSVWIKVCEIVYYVGIVIYLHIELSMLKKGVPSWF